VKNKENTNKHREMRKFWCDLGVDMLNVELLDQTTRAGACDTGHLFCDTDDFREKAKSIALEHHLNGCLIPFAVPSIGWNGNHYLCCHDYEKKDPLGNIESMDLLQVNTEKEKRVINSDISICRKCNLDPVAQIQECLLRIDRGEQDDLSLTGLIEKMKRQRQRLKGSGDICV